MKYVEFKDFKIKYQINKIETIHYTDTYVIKKHKRFFDFLRELCMYSTFKHPCIMEIEEYSYNAKNYYYSMKRGDKIRNSYKNCKITINEIISDILSALLFLHKNGYGHFDIKEDNIIYLDGKAKLIDFELAEKCMLCDCKNLNYNSQYDYFVKDNIGFTILWRDPQFSYKGYNSIKSDLYALGLTIYDLIVYNNIDNLHKKRKNFISNLNLVQDVNIRNFISQCILPWKLRPHYELQNHIVITRKYENIEKQKFNFVNDILTPEKEIIYNTITSEIIKDLYYMRISAYESFHTIHLFRSVLHLLYPNYLNEVINKEGKTYISDDIRLLYLCCILISSQFLYLDIDFETILDIFDIQNKYNIIDVKNICFKILNQINFILYSTYFDYSNSKTYSSLFNETLKFSYNPNMIPIYEINNFNTNMKYIYIKLSNDDILNIQNVISYVDVNNYQTTVYNIPSISLKDYKKEMKSIIRNNKEYNFNKILLYNSFLAKIDEKLIVKFKKSMKKTLLKRYILKLIFDVNYN